MARRSRSLSELPGHLRVPILKRKDTERTQARLQAGLAGMEELRVLREHQQQLIGDTMARVEDRQQRLHSTPRRHSVDGLMTSGHPKMSRSIGQSPISHHDSISSWQSASSLASISEEGDAIASRDTDTNKSGLYQRYKANNISDNHKTPDNNSSNGGSPKSFEFSPQKRQLVRSQSYHEMTPRSWKSQEYICQRPKPNENLQSPTVFQSPNDVGNRSIRRSMSFSLSSGTGYHLSNGKTLSSYRRNSTSMIHDLQSGGAPRSYLGHILQPKGKRHGENQQRYPLSSISNIHIPAAGESSNLYGQNYTANVTSSPDRNCSQISWDNLLKTIGISSSASSLTSLVEDENTDKIDDVFYSAENQEKTADDTETPPPLPGKFPRHKIGRSFSFCHGNAVQNSRKYSQLVFQERVGNSVEEEEDAASSQSCAYLHQSFQPIMRRASMQCEAVLTKSGMAKRRVNPIQDVDINTLTNPGPVHAVMLQYTSPKVGAPSTSTNGSDIISSGRKMTNSKVIHETQLSESEHKYLKIACHKRGNGCELVKTGTEFQDLQLSASECENRNRRVHNTGDHPMNTADFVEGDLSKQQDIERHSPELKEKSEDGNNIERRTSRDKIVKMEITPSVIVKENYARGSCGGRLNEPGVIPADAFSKTSSNSIDSASTSVHVDGFCVKTGMQNLNPSNVVEFSEKDSNLEKSQGAFDPCLTESDSLEVNVGSSKHPHCLVISSNGHQAASCEINGNDDNPCSSVPCNNLMHLGFAERASGKIETRGNESMAIASKSTPADIEINDSNDGHVIKYCQDDVNKTSSDVSIISDEGYSTCESVASTTKACLQSRENDLNLLDSSSVSGLISSVVGDTFDTKLKTDQASVAGRCVGECGSQESPKLSSQSNGHTQSGKKQFPYEDVAILETGVDLVWNPERCKNSTKSLHRGVCVYKSLKQTAV